MKYFPAIILIILCSSILVSCSGSGGVTPDVSDESNQILISDMESIETGQSNLWGFWDISIDPETMEVNVDNSRQADFSLNLVSIFNQFPSSVSANVVSSHIGPYGSIYYVDLTITHPYPDNNMLNIYDVRGIFMGNGTGTLAYNTDLHYPVLSVDQSIDGIDHADVDKPDGYTRWFNNPEFSTGGSPLFSYTPGEIAPANYSPEATLCPYQYYADGLGATENACDWLEANPSSKGVFSSGGSNTRRFAVRFPTAETKLQFGYAIVANWEGGKPGDHPSNTDEAIAGKATVHDGLYYESPSNNGGDLVMDFTLYGWKSLPTSIYIESTVLSSNYTLTPVEIVPTGMGVNYASWHVEITADNVTSLDGNEVWIVAEFANSDYKNDFGTSNLAGDDPLAAFFRFDVPVSQSSECGTFVWVSKAGGQLIDRGRAMTTLSDDSIVVTGEFSQAFCPNNYRNIPCVFGEGEANETTLIDQHLGDIFIARYNSDGSLAWAKQAGGQGADTTSGITSLSDDSIVVTGLFGSNCYGNLEYSTFGKGESNEIRLYTSSSLGNFFIAKYNPDGTLAWAKRATGAPYYNNEYTQRGADVAAMSDGSIIATGVFANHATFGEGEPNETTITYHPYFWDTFIAKYNNDGTLAWVKRQGGTSLEKPYAITERSDNSFVLGGGFGTSMGFPAIFGEGEPNQTTLYTVGREDIFVASYNADGTLQWADRAGSILGDSAKGITSLSDYSIVMCGSYGNAGDPGECPATFGEGQLNETTLEHSGWDDIFIARYDVGGNLAWAKRAAGESQEIASDITTLSNDMFAITGEFWEPCTFGEGEPDEFTLIPYPNSDPNFSYDDIFVAWYNADGTVSCGNKAGGRSYDCSYACTSLSDDSVVAAGDVAGTYGAVFGEGEDNETWVFGQSYELFVARWYK